MLKIFLKISQNYLDASNFDMYLKNVPDLNAPIKRSLSILSITHSRLTSLEGDNLQNLSKAKNLYFRSNFIRYIDPDAFKGTTNVQVLSFHDNLLTFVPPNLLKRMPRMFRIDISYNNLLHVDGLFSTTHPVQIYLDFNNISDINRVLYPNMEAVQSFNLSGNPIKRLSEWSFASRIPNVRTLDLSHCEIREVNLSSFTGVTQIFPIYLNLGYNLIDKVTDDYEGDIPFTTGVFNLDGNKLQSVPVFPHRSKTTYVDIDGNQIQFLTDEDFAVVTRVLRISVRGNRICRIDSNTFQPLKNTLEYLLLDRNSILSLNGSIRNLARIRRISLTYNSIQTFAEDEFAFINSITELYLQHNQIKTIGQLQMLPKLEQLDITHNDINLITPEQLPRTLKFLSMGDNPLECDCELQPLALHLNTSGSVSKDVGVCPESENVTGHRRRECPELCSCACIHRESVSFMSLDCSSRNFSFLPEIFKDGLLQDTAFAQNRYPSLRIEDRILGVNLENNSLDSVEGMQLPSDLIRLYLAGNELRRFPDPLFDNLLHLEEVSLSGNPWECDCNALNFKTWLTSNFHIVQDINNTRCGANDAGLGGRVIVTLTDFELCPAKVGVIVAATISVLIFLLLCLAVKILYTRYELSVKAFLWSHGCTCVKEEDLDNDKMFDAFLSFSHVDGEFVTKEVISVIQNRDPNIQLCIHYRDFRPGEFIHDNITHAVQSSKRTVLILSKNFLESEWCIVEFRTAHVQALRDRIHRIVVIKVGDLPTEMDLQIQAYLDSTTYLTWGEGHFWDKLLYILPSSSGIRNPASRKKNTNKII